MTGLPDPDLHGRCGSGSLERKKQQIWTAWANFPHILDMGKKKNLDKLMPTFFHLDSDSDLDPGGKMGWGLGVRGWGLGGGK